MKRFVHGLVCSLVVIICTACGDDAPGGDEPLELVGLVFTSDESVILFDEGGTYAFEVAGETASGELVPVTGVQWQSNDPQIASLSDEGVVTALASLGQARITATLDEHVVEGSVFIAVARPGTRRVDSEDVRLVEGTRVRLAANDTYAAIAPGDVLVSGSRARILVRVVSVEPDGGELDLIVEPASLVDAFEELDVDVFVEMAEAEEEPSEESLGRVEGPLAMRSSPQVIDPSFDCEADIEVATLTLEGPRFDVRPRLGFRARERIVGGQLVETQLLSTASATLEATTGSLSVDLNARLSVTCEATLGDFPALAVLIGPVVFEATLTPKLGIDAELEGSLGTIGVRGPSASLTFSKTVGIRYTPAAGIELVDEAPVVRQDFEPPGVTSELGASLSAVIAPYIGINVGISVGIGTAGLNVELVEVQFAQARFFIEAALEMTAPFDPDDVDYAGPAWAVEPGLDASLFLELGDDSAVGWVLAELGLPTSTGPLFEIDPLRFGPWIESPQPQLSVELAAQMATLVATVPEPFNEGTVSFLGFDRATGEMVDLGEGASDRALDQVGRAVYVWRFTLPGEGEGPQTIDLGARFVHPLWTLPGLPYASPLRTIRLERPPNPPPPPPQVDVATTVLTLWGSSALAVVDGTLFRFEPRCLADPASDPVLCDCTSFPERCTVRPVAGLDGLEIVAVAASEAPASDRAIALDSDGGAWAIGDDFPFQQACGDPDTCPVQALDPVASIDVGATGSAMLGETFYALTDSGLAYAWGDTSGCAVASAVGCGSYLAAPSPVRWQRLVNGEDCLDGIDNDADELADCDDPDCGGECLPPVVTKARVGGFAEVAYLIDVSGNLWLVGEDHPVTPGGSQYIPSLLLGPDATLPAGVDPPGRAVDVGCDPLRPRCLVRFESGDVWDPLDTETWRRTSDSVAILGRNGNVAVLGDDHVLLEAGSVVPTDLGELAWLNDYLPFDRIVEMDGAVALASGSGTIVALLSDGSLVVWYGVIESDAVLRDFAECSANGDFDYRTNGCPVPVVIDPP